MEQGTGCGGGLHQVRPTSHEIAPGLHPGKVDKYKDADRGNPTYEKEIAIEVTMMVIT
jgi:hypothetical protein